MEKAKALFNLMFSYLYSAFPILLSFPQVNENGPHVKFLWNFGHYKTTHIHILASVFSVFP